MIFISFSSAEDVWSNDVNKYNTFSSQGTGNPPFRFFWDTRYNNDMFFNMIYVKTLKLKVKIFMGVYRTPALKLFNTHFKNSGLHGPKWYQCLW